MQLNFKTNAIHYTHCHINASVTQLKLPHWHANAMQLYASYCVAQLQCRSCSYLSRRQLQEGVAVSALVACMYTEHLYVLVCGWVDDNCIERGCPRTVLTHAQMYSCTNVYWTFWLDWTTLQLAEWAAIARRGALSYSFGWCTNVHWTFALDWVNPDKDDEKSSLILLEDKK